MRVRFVVKYVNLLARIPRTPTQDLVQPMLAGIVNKRRIRVKVRIARAVVALERPLGAPPGFVVFDLIPKTKLLWPNPEIPLLFHHPT